jgi:Family of unknown function (DUF6263)
MPFLRSCLVLTCLATFAAAQQRTELHWKFEPGKTLYQEITIDGRQTTTAKGTQQPTRILQTLHVAWTPVQMRPDHSWVIRQQILGLSMTVQANGKQVSYDSSNPAVGPKELADSMELLIGAEFLFVISPEMKTIQVGGVREFISKTNQANPRVRQAVQGLFSEESLRQLSDQTFAVLPAGPVAPGDRWVVENHAALGPLGTFAVQHIFTYEGPVPRADDAWGKLHRIRMETIYGQHQPAAAGILGSSGQVKQFDLTGSRAQGILFFDAEKGRIDSAQEEVSLTGKLTIESGGQVEEMETNQEHKITIRSSDKPIQDR